MALLFLSELRSENYPDYAKFLRPERHCPCGICRIDGRIHLVLTLIMPVLGGIRTKIEGRQYEFSRHAVDQSIIREISVAEVEEAVLGRSEIIEDYPDDKYGPSCLILGFTEAGRPLHVQCSYPSRELVKIITIYEPTPDFWRNLRVRESE